MSTIASRSSKRTLRFKRNDVVRFRKRSQVAAGLGAGLDEEFKVEMVTTEEGRTLVVLRVGEGRHSALIKVPPGHLAIVERGQEIPAEILKCAARLAKFEGPIPPNSALAGEALAERLIMLALAIGMSPVIAFGLAAWWARSRAARLEIVNLSGEAPASKRSKRTRPINAVVLHQMGFSRGNDLRRYTEVTAHFVIAPDGGVAQLHLLSTRLSSSHGFNGRSVAIEFAGNLQSVDGRWWRAETYGRNTLTRAQVEAGRLLLRVQRVRFVLARRQSDADRGGTTRGLRLGHRWGIGRLCSSGCPMGAGVLRRHRLSNPR